MKEKRSKEIKARSCINGAPQREYIPKEEATSPTVNNDSIFITGAVNAYECRSVATLDVSRAFLHTFLTGEKVIMVLRGDLCELIVRVDPTLYTKYRIVERCCKVKILKPFSAISETTIEILVKNWSRNTIGPLHTYFGSCLCGSLIFGII